MNNNTRMTILSKIDALFDECNSLIKDTELTHPLLYSYWSSYLTKKRDSLMLLSSSLENFVQTCNNNDVQDVTKEQIVMLYLLLQN